MLFTIPVYGQDVVLQLPSMDSTRTSGNKSSHTHFHSSEPVWPKPYRPSRFLRPWPRVFCHVTCPTTSLARFALTDPNTVQQLVKQLESITFPQSSCRVRTNYLKLFVVSRHLLCGEPQPSPPLLYSQED